MDSSQLWELGCRGSDSLHIVSPSVSSGYSHTRVCKALCACVGYLQCLVPLQSHGHEGKVLFTGMCGSPQAWGHQ